MLEAMINREAIKFKNHWLAKSGRDAVKRDWVATWQNWVIRAIEFAAKEQPPPKKKAEYGLGGMVLPDLTP